MSDYFNYGFNEETWILYSDKVKKLNKRVENPIQASRGNLLLENRFPKELGGFGKPLNLELETFDSVNLLANNPEIMLMYFNFQQNDFYERLGAFFDNNVLDIGTAKKY